MAAKKQTLSNALLDAVLSGVAYSSPATLYLALYTVAPTATTPGTEVVAAGPTGYARQEVTSGFVSPPVAGVTSNIAPITFPEALIDWTTVVSASICVSGVRGTNDELYFGDLTVHKAVGVGDVLSFAAGALVVSES